MRPPSSRHRGLDGSAVATVTPEEPNTLAPQPSETGDETHGDETGSADPLDMAPEEASDSPSESENIAKKRVRPRHNAAEYLQMAKDAAASGHHRRALTYAKWSEAQAHNLEAIEQAALAACRLHKAKTARRLVQQLSASRADEVRAVCAAERVELTDSAAPSEKAAAQPAPPAPPEAAPVEPAPAKAPAEPASSPEPKSADPAPTDPPATPKPASPPPAGTTEPTP